MAGYQRSMLAGLALHVPGFCTSPAASLSCIPAPVAPPSSPSQREFLPTRDHSWDLRPWILYLAGENDAAHYLELHIWACNVWAGQSAVAPLAERCTCRVGRISAASSPSSTQQKKEPVEQVCQTLRRRFFGSAPPPSSLGEFPGGDLPLFLLRLFSEEIEVRPQAATGETTAEQRRERLSKDNGGSSSLKKQTQGRCELLKHTLRWRHERLRRIWKWRRFRSPSRCPGWSQTALGGSRGPWTT